MKWSSTGYQDPNEKEWVLIINPEDNSVSQAYFIDGIFYEYPLDDYCSSLPDEFKDVKWWMRFDDIPMPGERMSAQYEKRKDERRDHSLCRCDCPLIANYPIPEDATTGSLLTDASSNKRYWLRSINGENKWVEDEEDDDWMYLHDIPLPEDDDNKCPISCGCDNRLPEQTDCRDKT